MEFNVDYKIEKEKKNNKHMMQICLHTHYLSYVNPTIWSYE